jgi:hypothetical protein
MVAVEEKNEQILAPEPLFYYKEFSLYKTKDIILLLASKTAKLHKKTARRHF